MTQPDNANAPVVRRLDYSILFIMSIFCLLYIRYDGRAFSETSVQFSFLDFPVFIGEFILMTCLILFLIRMVFAKSPWQIWYGVAIFYFGFVILKALWGYMHWGVLALRDAAMFYYASFAVFGYVCFRPELLKRWVILILYAAVLWLFFDSRFNDIWLMPRIFIGLALACRFPDKRFGLLMGLGVLWFTPWRYFIDASRSVILGNFVSLAFLLMVFPLNLEKRTRMLSFGCCLFLLLVLGAYIFHFSGYKPAQGLLAMDKLNEIIGEMEGIIAEKRSSFKRIEVAQVAIFRPNKDVRVQSPDEPIQTSTIVPAEIPAGQVDDPTKGMKLGNSVFRILLWKDAARDIVQEKRFFGIDFGKPFRSQRLEIIRSAVNELRKVGWIAMHNSYLNIIYRAGVLGIVMIVGMAFFFVQMVWIFIRLRSVTGLFLCAALIVPLVIASFAVSLELPYAAIPIWSLFGLTLGFAHYKSSSRKTNSIHLIPGQSHAHSDRS